MHQKFACLRVCSVVATAFLSGAAAHATLIYSNIPESLAPNYASLGYQATQTAELGDHIRFGGTARNLQSATITMSNWARASTYGSQEAGYFHDLTFNIYKYANGNAGELLATLTQNTFVPWRPEASTACPGGTAWQASNGGCYNGLAFNVTFDFSSLGVTLPDEIVYGVAFNTNTWGYNPIGAPGPYESLNYAVGAIVPPSVGTDVDPTTMFRATGANPALSADGQWTNPAYAPMVRFEATEASPVPEPATFALLGLALAASATARRRARRQTD